LEESIRPQSSDNRIDQGPYRYCVITTISHLDHTVFDAGLIDGGRVSMATEVPLAYQDILFLDELTESPGNFLGFLQQPVEAESVARALIVPIEQSPGVRSTIHEVITSSDQKPSSLEGLYDATESMVLFSWAE
jgi:Magnesium chelatase, subunit ChlI